MHLHKTVLLCLSLLIMLSFVVKTDQIASLPRILEGAERAIVVKFDQLIFEGGAWKVTFDCGQACVMYENNGPDAEIKVTRDDGKTGRIKMPSGSFVLIFNNVAHFYNFSEQHMPWEKPVG